MSRNINKGEITVGQPEIFLSSGFLGVGREQGPRFRRFSSPIGLALRWPERYGIPRWLEVV